MDRDQIIDEYLTEHQHDPADVRRKASFVAYKARALQDAQWYADATIDYEGTSQRLRDEAIAINEHGNPTLEAMRELQRRLAIIESARK